MPWIWSTLTRAFNDNNCTDGINKNHKRKTEPIAMRKLQRVKIIMLFDDYHFEHSASVLVQVP